MRIYVKIATRGWTTRGLICCGIAALSLIASPTALGATFTVNDGSDAPDFDGDVEAAGPFDGTCDASPPGAPVFCTLRAAVAEAESTAAADVISFDLGMTALGTDPTITLGNAFDELINNPLTVDGCVRDAPNSPEPCVGIHWNPGCCLGRGFWFDGDGAYAVRGIAFSNWFLAVQYRGATALVGSLDLQNNWFGLRIDGTAPANTAIQGQGAEISGDNITIGGPDGASGTAPADRNVFANAFKGVHINDGANAAGSDTLDNIVIQGNYFGTMPDGTTAANPGNGINLSLSNWTATGASAPPSGTVIGGTVSEAAAATPQCDGVCNLFGPVNNTANRNLDLTGDAAVLGESPAGSTTVAGNFFGMNVNGTAAFPTTGDPIFANGVPTLTVGGDTRDRNYITSSALRTGITANAAGAKDTLVASNYFGLDPNGDALAPPGIGASLSSPIADPTVFIGNRLNVGNTNGLQLASPSATLAENSNAIVQDNVFGIEADGDDASGGPNGIRVVESSGNTISGNTVGNATGNGIRLEQTATTTLTGNYLGTDSGGADRGNGGSGLQIVPSGGGVVSTTNTIGGTTAASENVISFNDNDGITITGADPPQSSDFNLILRNRGTGNTGPFIDLGDDGAGNVFPDGPNDGIDEPAIATAGANAATGTGARANAAIRVYSKASAAQGEVQAFLGTANADGAGNWQVNYAAPVANGTLVTASQSDTANNSSELLAPAVATDGIPPAIAVTSGPSGPTNNASPTFGFAPEGGATAQCRIDSGPLGPCTGAGSHTTSGLADGPHTFSVTATDAALNTATAARSFTVDTAAPTVDVLKKKGGGSKAKFTLTPSENGATLECRVDKADYAPCATSFKTKRLDEGRHKLRTRGTDLAGNVGPEALKKFRISG